MPRSELRGMADDEGPSAPATQSGPDGTPAKNAGHAVFQAPPVDGESLRDCVDRLLDGCRVVGEAHDEARCQNAPREQLLEEQRPEVLAALPVGVLGREDEIA